MISAFNQSYTPAFIMAGVLLALSNVFVVVIPYVSRRKREPVYNDPLPLPHQESHSSSTSFTTIASSPAASVSSLMHSRTSLKPEDEQELLEMPL